jgi:hypothetical protein
MMPTTPREGMRAKIFEIDLDENHVLLAISAAQQAAFNVVRQSTVFQQPSLGVPHLLLSLSDDWSACFADRSIRLKFTGRE